MLKLFLTSDNHIGLKYASHARAGVLAAKRTEAFAEMVRAANAEDCALFVIAGDLFENTRSMPKKDVAALLGTLSQFAGYVAVLPGNHDYYDGDAAVWRQFRDLNTYDNIMLLNEFRPYEIPVGGRTVLYPAPCRSLHSQAGQNNLGWIKHAGFSEDAINIGIAHGAVEGETIDSEGQYFLMTRAELEEIPVDVWLLGHTHVPFPRDLTDEFSPCGKIFNPGTHVQTDVSCNTEGQCFIIEIGDDKTVRAKKFVSGNIRFYRKTVALRAGEMEDILKRELEKFGGESVVDLVLSGAVTADEYENRAAILDNLLNRFIEGTYTDYALTRQISRKLIGDEFPETSFSARLLTALLDNPKEAQLAYELLSSMKEGK